MSEPIKKLDWANRRRRHVESMVTTKSLLDILADLFAVDREAMISWLNLDIRCNEKFAKILDIQGCHVSPLGFLNGLLAKHGQPKLEPAYGDDGRVIGFKEHKICCVPPPGWHCTHPARHDGPCAAVPNS